MRHPVAPLGPEWRPGVVGHLARPDELPQRRQRLGGVEPGRGEEIEPELRAARPSVARMTSTSAPSSGSATARWAEHWQLLTEVQRHPIETGADPDDLTRGTDRVEPARLIPGDTPGQHVALPQRHRERQALERHERLSKGGATIDPVPGREEPPERDLLDRLDLPAQDRERRPADPAEDIRVAPLPLDPAGPDLAPDEEIPRLEPGQELAGPRELEPVPLGQLGGRERPVGPCVPQQQPLDASATGSRNAEGSPPGGMTPNASR